MREMPNLSAGVVGEDMHLAALLDPELIRTRARVRDREDAIRLLAELMAARGYVTPDFLPAVLKREKEFPTGLPTQEVAIALPHTEAMHVQHSRIAVGVLEQPVAFHMMGSPDQIVQVRVVFLLAIADNDSQVLALKQLADLFQDGSTLGRVAAAEDEQTVYAVLLEGIRRLRPAPPEQAERQTNGG